MSDAKQKFISECIADCIRKGTPKDQASAICYSKWEKKHSKNNSKKIYKYNSNKSIEQKIFDFFVNNPNPDDSKVHAFAESNNIEPSQLEEKIYQLISGIVSGGLSAGKNISNIPEEKIKIGVEIELEHVDKNNPFAYLIARKIAIDHLIEDINYYEKLIKMEKGE